jgi:hypothetical protein
MSPAEYERANGYRVGVRRIGESPPAHRLLLPYRATSPDRVVDAACAVRFRSAHCGAPVDTVIFPRRSVSLRRRVTSGRSGALPERVSAFPSSGKGPGSTACSETRRVSLAG